MDDQPLPQRPPRAAPRGRRHARRDGGALPAAGARPGTGAEQPLPGRVVRPRRGGGGAGVPGLAGGAAHRPERLRRVRAGPERAPPRRARAARAGDLRGAPGPGRRPDLHERAAVDRRRRAGLAAPRRPGPGRRLLARAGRPDQSDPALRDGLDGHPRRGRRPGGTARAQPGAARGAGDRPRGPAAPARRPRPRRRGGRLPRPAAGRGARPTSRSGLPTAYDARSRSSGRRWRRRPRSTRPRSTPATGPTGSAPGSARGSRPRTCPGCRWGPRRRPRSRRCRPSPGPSRRGSRTRTPPRTRRPHCP